MRTLPCYLMNELMLLMKRSSLQVLLIGQHGA